MVIRVKRVHLLVATALIACGDSSPADSSDSTSTADTSDADLVDLADLTDSGEVSEAYAPCPAAERVGGFAVVLADGYSAVEGRVASGVVPANVREVSASEGGCRLLEGRRLSCSPACGAGETCGFDGVCIAYPTSASVGVVSVSGLTATLSMSPTSIGSYTNGATQLPHPALVEGGLASVSAPGEVLPGFTLTSRGIAALETSQDEVALARDREFEVTWTPGGEGSARVRLVLDLAHHGGIAASLECDDLADDGSFAVPATLVTRLMDIGLAGFPTLTVTRRTASSTTISPGCVDFVVSSEVVLPVVIEGLVSCVEDEECPEGQTCQFDLTCK